MAQRHDEFTAAGARLVGISVDPPPVNAAMVEKLQLPFSLLSDPDGSQAIKPYDVWHDGKDVARPALVVVGTDGEEAFRQVSGDFADRISEQEAVDAVEQLDLPETSQEQPAPGDPQPSERAFPVASLAPYYRGAKFAATAIAMRVPEAKAEAEELTAEVARYAEAAKKLQAG